MDISLGVAAFQQGGGEVRHLGDILQTLGNRTDPVEVAANSHVVNSGNLNNVIDTGGGIVNGCVSQPNLTFRAADLLFGCVGVESRAGKVTSAVEEAIAFFSSSASSTFRNAPPKLTPTTPPFFFPSARSMSSVTFRGMSDCERQEECEAITGFELTAMAS